MPSLYFYKEDKMKENVVNIKTLLANIENIEISELENLITLTDEINKTMDKLLINLKNTKTALEKIDGVVRNEMKWNEMNWNF